MSTYTAIIDTCILALLLCGAWMDRNNKYFK